MFFVRLDIDQFLAKIIMLTIYKVKREFRHIILAQCYSLKRAPLPQKELCLITTPQYPNSTVKLKEINLRKENISLSDP